MNECPQGGAVTKTVQARDLLELLAWIQRAERDHPEAKIYHVERVVEIKETPDATVQR